MASDDRGAICLACIEKGPGENRLALSSFYLLAAYFGQPSAFMVSSDSGLAFLTAGGMLVLL